jgi:hypothetical protein
MFTASDVEQLKTLLASAKQTNDDYARVLELRTKERDTLIQKVRHQGENVVQLTPEIILRERKEASNAILKIARRRISQTLGMPAGLRKILDDMIDE